MASPSGIPQLGDLGPGAHVGQLYRDQQDLLDTLVPFFAAGLAADERCVWVTSYPLSATQARAALAHAVPDLAKRERCGQIEIIDHSDWYTRAGDLTTEQVIERWLSSEEAALRAGYSGLRISGNTYWLRPEQWGSFADYEMRVHAAFQGRKIVALCSYSLAKCHSHEVVDVMRNHNVSIVRTNDTWEVVHGATAALVALEPGNIAETETRPHAFELYREEFPAATVAERFVTAMGARHAAAGLLRRPHLARVRYELAERGVDVEAAIGRGQLTLLDADELASHSWRQSELRTDVLDGRLSRPLHDIVALYGRVAVYDELVDVIAQTGDRQAAIALEHWWNVQLVRGDIELTCGLSISALPEAERLRGELAELTNVLAREMARRQAAEAALAASKAGQAQLVRLDRLAAALGEVTARRELVGVLTDVVASTLGIDCLVAIETPDHGPVTTLVEHGASDAVDTLRSALDASLDRSSWSSSGDGVLGATVVLPIIANGARLGACAFGFTREHVLDSSFRALAQDVTRQIGLAFDRVLAYERLEHERERAELASRAKDEFLAMLGHELRNPLSPILTATQLMRLRGGDAHEKERVVIERQCKHMMRLVDDLLDVSRITRGKVELRRRAVEISEIVATAVELASPALEERSHKLTLDVPGAGVVVHADPARLAQVLCNLLTNAAKYTPTGGEVRLRVQAAPKSVTVSVCDNGIGIDGKLLPHIFDLFVQGRQGIDRASGGLGLGLAIAKSILEMHGGSIRAASEGYNRGSELTFELPRFANTRPAQRNSQNSGAFAVQSVRKRRVLVVDDNEDAAFLFSEALRRLGHHVEVAYDGPSALEVARANPPEVAFLDIGLPVMDGYELGRRLIELAGENNAPPRLVAVTGYGHTSDRERSREAGFDLHLVKPIELAQVQDALQKLD